VRGGGARGVSGTVSIVPAGTVAYGIQLPIQALSPRFAADWEHDASVAELVQIAQAAERGGFLYVAVCDHVAIPRARSQVTGRDVADAAADMGTTWYDPVATLGFLAAATSTVRLMTNVLVPAYRHPLQVAKAFATLDHLSGGRVILGVGAGHVDAEFAALGVPFAERGRLLDEAIDAVAAAWAGEFSEHRGEQWSYGAVGQRPRPVQQPRPPIWIGGLGRPALRRVAERGDGWVPQGTPLAQLPADLDFIRARRDEVRPGAELEFGYICGKVHVGAPDWDLPAGTIAGEPARVAKVLNHIASFGVSHLQVGVAARSAAETCDQLERFGAEVAPLLERST
jgi:probable F420-dependent oxidoreductase